MPMAPTHKQALIPVRDEESDGDPCVISAVEAGSEVSGCGIQDGLNDALGRPGDAESNEPGRSVR
jgi:hypothetical protein